MQQSLSVPIWRAYVDGPAPKRGVRPHHKADNLTTRGVLHSEELESTTMATTGMGCVECECGGGVLAIAKERFD